MKTKRWIVNNRNKSEDIVSHLMGIRSFKNIDKSQFFFPQQSDLLDPFNLKDMDQAVLRIQRAIDQRENIWIYGDYDVDGISAVSILLLTFQLLGIQAQYYIPKRIEEGYGINIEALDYIKEQGGNLIISVDCGITSITEATHAKSKNLDLIITDHHQCKENIPDAIAVIDPKQIDCQYENKNICGAGIALKLAQGIFMSGNINKPIDELIEIAAIATIADIVELTGENRTIVKLGLDSLKNPRNLGLKALIIESGNQLSSLTSSSVAFGIAPRINSSGRMGKAPLGVELFLSNTEEKAKDMAKMLDVLNKQRQNVEKEIYEEALSICEKKQDQTVLVAASENWHSGVIGIVASKITERFHKPSFIIAIEDGDMGKGSGRSIEGLHLFRELEKMDDILEKFGGHAQAAGVTIHIDNLPDFEKRINQSANSILQEQDLVAEIEVDDELNKEEIQFDLYEKIMGLEPFGIGNTRPKFLLKQVPLTSFRFMGKAKNHIKAQLRNDLEIIGFHKAELLEQINQCKEADIIFELDKNEFKGNTKLQLLVRDMKPALEENSYIYHFSQIFKKNKRYFLQTRKIDFEPKEESKKIEEFSFSDLHQGESYLFLTVSPSSFHEVIKKLYYRDIDFSINIQDKSHFCTVLLMPIIDKIEVSIYNNIILCGDEWGEDCISALPKEKVFFLPTRCNNYQIPDRNTVVKLYSLLSRKKESIYKINDLSSFLGTDGYGLVITLEILTDMSLIEYFFDEVNASIKIIFSVKNSKEKNVFDENPTVKIFRSIQKNG